MGSKNEHGYGGIRDAGKEGRLLKTHRVAWELTNGPIPDGSWVLHKCDNPSCVRPDHLYLGDQFANMADMVSRGRRRPDDLLPGGEHHHSAKLTDRTVLELRQRWFGGESIGLLAREFGVSKSAAWAAARGDTWRHL